MDRERVLRFIERQVHGWEDPAGVGDLAADYGDAGTFRHPFDPPATGEAAIRAVYERFHATCRDAEVTLGPVAAEGDRAAFEWTYSFTVEKNGRRTVLPGVTVARFAGDRIADWNDYWDSRALYDYTAAPLPGQQRRPVTVIDSPPAFDPEEIIRVQIAGWEAPEALETMYSQWAEGATFTDPVTPLTDLAGLRDVFEHIHRLNSEIRTTLHGRVATGNLLVLEWSIVSRGRRSGREVPMSGASWIELRDGRIIAWRDYWDTELIRPRRGASADKQI